MIKKERAPSNLSHCVKIQHELEQKYQFSSKANFHKDIIQNVINNSSRSSKIFL